MPIPYLGPAIASGEPYNKTAKYTLALKSRWPGDENPIYGLHVRALDVTSENRVLTDGEGYLDIGTTQCSVCPYQRPQLAHSRFAGIQVNSGTGYVKIVPSVPFRVVAMQIKPQNVTTQFSVGNGVSTSYGTVTFTKGTADHFYTVTHSGTSAVYVNGTSVTSGATMYIPFPVLVIASFTTTSNDIRIGNTYTGTGAVQPVVFDNVATMIKYASGVATAWAAGDFTSYTNLFYRKPTGSTLVDSTIAFTGDTVVPNPESWPVVSSS
jgi:hypothetical protein